MSKALHARVQEALVSRKARDMMRTLDPDVLVSAAAHPDLVDLSSNDYLSLSHSAELRARYLARLSAASHSPYGPASSRLLDGNTPQHLALERQLCAFLGGESALFFNSGFDANVSIWSTLPDAADYIVYDALIHASTHDGMRKSRVPASHRVPFAHNSAAALAAVVADIRSRDAAVREGTAAVWVAVESLYSMDGDLAPLREMVDAVDATLGADTAHFVVDEAHSTGLYGPRGRGLVAALALEPRIRIRVHTFGKALSCSGAVALLSPVLRLYLINYARPLIYSTVVPYVNVIAISNVCAWLAEGRTEAAAAHMHSLARSVVGQLAQFITGGERGEASRAGNAARLVSTPRADTSAILSLPDTLSVTGSEPRPTTNPSIPQTTPIIPLLTPFPRELSRYMIDHGFLARPLVYPTVPKGQERVRICLHSHNTQAEIDRLVCVLRDWVEIKTRDLENGAPRSAAAPQVLVKSVL